jgi:hypothetical protein
MVTFQLEVVDDAEVAWDLQQSFQAMDYAKVGRLDIDAAYTVLLGLGYLRDYQMQDRFTPAIMRSAVLALRRKQKLQKGNEFAPDDGDWVTLDMLKEIIEMYSFVLQRDRSAPVFQSAIADMDQDHKGFLDATDIQKFATSVGELISLEEAEAMVAVTREMIEGEEGDNTSSSSKSGETTLPYGYLQQLLSRPADDPDGVL